MVGEVRDGERPVRIDEVEAVMGDPAALGEGRLGGPDVQSAVHLPRIRGDDLRGDPLPRQALRDIDREPRLAGGGGPGDHEERRRGGHAETSTPRSA